MQTRPALTSELYAPHEHVFVRTDSNNEVVSTSAIENMMHFQCGGNRQILRSHLHEEGIEMVTDVATRHPLTSDLFGLRESTFVRTNDGNTVVSTAAIVDMLHYRCDGNRQRLGHLLLEEGIEMVIFEGAEAVAA